MGYSRPAVVTQAFTVDYIMQEWIMVQLAQMMPAGLLFVVKTLCKEECLLQSAADCTALYKFKLVSLRRASPNPFPGLVK